MITPRALLLLLVTLQLAVGYVSAQRSTDPPSETLKAFLTWRDAVGLQDTVDQVEERSDSSGKYLLILDVDQLETVIGQELAQALYERLFIKLLAVAGVEPQKIELQIRSRQGGYCDPEVIQNTLQMKQPGVVRNRKVFQGRRGIRCALDFEAIQRYEERTKTAVDQAGINAPSESRSSAATRLTTVLLRRVVLDRYTKRGGTVAVTGFSDNWLSVVVRQIRAEVIPDKNYWERLQLMVFLQPSQSGTHVRLIVDGKFGAGFSTPSEQSYVDMEPTYTSNLVDYGKALVLFLVEAK